MKIENKQTFYFCTYLFGVIVQVKVVFKKTVVGDTFRLPER